jgi:hypothetical protein
MIPGTSVSHLYLLIDTMTVGIGAYTMLEKAHLLLALTSR